MKTSVSAESVEDFSQTTSASRNSTGRTVTTEPTVPEGERLSKDVVFGLLSNGRRRRVLKYLNEGPGAATLSDLAEHIASSENDKPVAALSSDERKCVYVGLYQCHLPKMDDADVIDYDQSRGTIEIRPEADRLLAHLSVAPDGTTQTESWLRTLVSDSLRALETRFAE